MRGDSIVVGGRTRRAHALDQRLKYLTAQNKTQDLSSQVLFSTSSAVNENKHNSKKFGKQTRVSILGTDLRELPSPSKDSNPVSLPLQISDDGYNIIDLQNGMMAGHLVVFNDGSNINKPKRRVLSPRAREEEKNQTFWCVLVGDVLLWYPPLVKASEKTKDIIKSKSVATPQRVEKPGRLHTEEVITENDTFDSPKEISKNVTSPADKLDEEDHDKFISFDPNSIPMGSLHMSKVKEVLRHGTNSSMKVLFYPIIYTIYRNLVMLECHSVHVRPGYD
jgi:hypothetical protein